MTIASAALLLFLILDPLGNIPVFLGLLRTLPPHRQRVVLAREMLIALAVLMLFLWGGRYALDLMHLRQESVSRSCRSPRNGCSRRCASATSRKVKSNDPALRRRDPAALRRAGLGT